MYCHHQSPLFHQIALAQSGQDTQQQRTWGLTEISQRNKSTIHTNIKVVSWSTQYKQQKPFRVMSCLKLYLSHVLLLAVFSWLDKLHLSHILLLGFFYGSTVQVGLGLLIVEALSSYSGMEYTG